MYCLVYWGGTADAQEAGQGEQRGCGGGNFMMRENRVGGGGKGNGRNMGEKAECDRRES